MLAKHTLTTIQQPVNLDTWHWHLSYANYQVVATMACSGLLPGMPTALLLAQPKCDICILGKQTKSLVPKVWEGAVNKLGIVWIDLAGPMHVQSCTSNKYIIDLMDNYTNMPWSVTLKSNSNALRTMRLASKCPESMWDKFYLTAAHLHKKPQLNHLMERPPLNFGTDMSLTTHTCMK